MVSPPILLTADFCLEVVVGATPHPDRFSKTDDPTSKKLFDLGVVDALSSALFVQNVKKRIVPWHIADSSLLSSRSATVQQAADSLQTGALSDKTHDA
ncbi:MAG TPA: hypothetical protein VHW46_12820 [Terracidiphilus sp.]|jgi:hypothetical protein|nr:hypothetical protein [Terracidiphilus sp.]